MESEFILAHRHAGRKRRSAPRNRAPVAVAVWPRHTTHAAQHALNGVFVAGITGRARFHFLRVRRTAFNLGHRSISQELVVVCRSCQKRNTTPARHVLGVVMGLREHRWAIRNKLDLPAAQGP